MKRCPQCERTYADESLSFCLADGALLSAPYVPGAPQTIPVSPNPNSTVAGLPGNQPGTSANDRRRFILAVLLGVFIVVLLAGSAVALLYDRSKAAVDPNARQATSPAPTATPTPTETAPGSSATPGANSTPPSAEGQARYSVTACQSIKDARTGLEWFVGPDRNMTWYEAQQWTTGLGICGGGWRMPSIEEIRGLFDPAATAGVGFLLNGQHYPAHIDPVFNAIGGGSWVWANERNGDSAQSFNLNQGIVVTYSALNATYSTRAFAVRTAKN